MVRAAHPAGQFQRGGRHHRTRRADTTGSGHSFPDRLEHQDHDCGVDRAARPGRQTEVQRPVSAYVPDVPNGENITVAELLKMRSGLYQLHSRPGAFGRHRMPTRIRRGHRRRCWTSRSGIRRSSRPTPPTSTTTPTTHCWASSPRRSAGARWPSSSRIDCSVRSASSRRRFPPPTDTSIPAPYSHGYMYGGSHYALADEDPYPADMQAAAQAGTLQPIDYTNHNSSYATAAGGAISTADDLATWMTSTGLGQGLQRRLPPTVVDEPASRGPARRPTGRSTGTGSRISASARTPPCTTTAVSFLASTRSWATTRITM